MAYPREPSASASPIPGVPAAHAPVRLCFESVAFHVAECAAHALIHIGSTIEGDDPSPPRHQVHQPFECRLHRLEVAVNIRVIKLDVRQNQRVGKVMHELRTLVEEGRIVLVSLEDEGPSL